MFYQSTGMLHAGNQSAEVKSSQLNAFSNIWTVIALTTVIVRFGRTVRMSSIIVTQIMTLQRLSSGYLKMLWQRTSSQPILLRSIFTACGGACSSWGNNIPCILCFLLLLFLLWIWFQGHKYVVYQFLVFLQLIWAESFDEHFYRGDIICHTNCYFGSCLICPSHW